MAKACHWPGYPKHVSPYMNFLPSLLHYPSLRLSSKFSFPKLNDLQGFEGLYHSFPCFLLSPSLCSESICDFPILPSTQSLQKDSPKIGQCWHSGSFQYLFSMMTTQSNLVTWMPSPYVLLFPGLDPLYILPCSICRLPFYSIGPTISHLQFYYQHILYELPTLHFWWGYVKADISTYEYQYSSLYLSKHQQILNLFQKYIFIIH